MVVKGAVHENRICTELGKAKRAGRRTKPLLACCPHHRSRLLNRINLSARGFLLLAEAAQLGKWAGRKKGTVGDW